MGNCCLPLAGDDKNQSKLKKMKYRIQSLTTCRVTKVSIISTPYDVREAADVAKWVVEAATKRGEDCYNPNEDCPQKTNVSWLKTWFDICENSMVVYVIYRSDGRGRFDCEEMGARSLDGQAQPGEVKYATDRKKKIIWVDWTKAFGIPEVDVLSAHAVTSSSNLNIAGPDAQNDIASHPRRFDGKLDKDLILDLAVSGKRFPITLHCYDFAGQYLYYVLFHLFLSNDGISLVVFSMREIIRGGSHAERAMHDVELWCSSVQFHAPRSPIILVGTHKDELTIKERKSAYSSIEAELDGILARIGGQVHDRIVENSSEGLRFFPVDNSRELPNDGDNTNGIAQLQRAIRTQCETLVERSEQLPVRWLKLQDSICQLLLESECPKWCVNTDELCERAQHCGITDEKELDSCLKYLTTFVGVVARMDSCPDLCVIDPQRHVRAMADILACRRVEELRWLTDSDEFKKGILTNSFFDTVFHSESEESLAVLREVMAKNHLIAQLDESKWLVPALMPFVLAPFQYGSEAPPECPQDGNTLLVDISPSCLSSIILAELLCRGKQDFGAHIELYEAHALLEWHVGSEDQQRWSVEILRNKKRSIRFRLATLDNQRGVLKRIKSLICTTAKHFASGRAPPRVVSGPPCPECSGTELHALERQPGCFFCKPKNLKIQADRIFSPMLWTEDEIEQETKQAELITVEPANNQHQVDSNVQSNTLTTICRSDLENFIQENGMETTFQEAVAAGASRPSTLKMILVGQGHAGKTSLWKALADEPFNPEEDSTHGLNQQSIATGIIATRQIETGASWRLLRAHEAIGEYEKACLQSIASGLVCHASRSSREDHGMIGERVQRRDEGNRGPLDPLLSLRATPQASITVLFSEDWADTFDRAAMNLFSRHDGSSQMICHDRYGNRLRVLQVAGPRFELDNVPFPDKFPLHLRLEQAATRSLPKPQESGSAAPRRLQNSFVANDGFVLEPYRNAVERVPGWAMCPLTSAIGTDPDWLSRWQEELDTAHGVIIIFSSAYKKKCRENSETAVLREARRIMDRMAEDPTFQVFALDPEMPGQDCNSLGFFLFTNEIEMNKRVWLKFVREHMSLWLWYQG